MMRMGPRIGICLVTLSMTAACNGAGDDGAMIGAAGTSGSSSGDSAITREAEVSQAPAEPQARAELPDTASAVPLAGVFGLLSLGTALGIRYLRRQ